MNRAEVMQCVNEHYWVGVCVFVTLLVLWALQYKPRQPTLKETYMEYRQQALLEGELTNARYWEEKIKEVENA